MVHWLVDANVVARGHMNLHCVSPPSPDPGSVDPTHWDTEYLHLPVLDGWWHRLTPRAPVTCWHHRTGIPSSSVTRTHGGMDNESGKLPGPPPRPLQHPCPETHLPPRRQERQGEFLSWQPCHGHPCFTHRPQAALSFRSGRQAGRRQENLEEEPL